MSSDVIISARNLSKTYRAYAHPLTGLLSRFGLGIGQHKEFHALKEVSFDIRRGETVGIIGRNGSGKSTLLQLICGIRKPSSGTLQVNGRISALLELGAGFHPEFTGRENVFMQGAIQGLSRQETEARFDDIATFADIGEYIDQPVKTYSSGMFMRLAFAVAVNVEPDILVVDEALAVGDIQFQKKCYERIRSLRKHGLTLVIVSHDYEVIRTMTNQALLLDKGVSLFWGETKQATFKYRKMLVDEEVTQLPSQLDIAVAKTERAMIHDMESYGQGGARITGLRILSESDEPTQHFNPGQKMYFEVSVLPEVFLSQINVSIVIRTPSGIKIYSWGTLNQDMAVWAGRAKGDIFWEKTHQPNEEITVKFELECNLGNGDYEVQVVVSKELERRYGSQQILHWRDGFGFFKVTMNSEEYFFGGLCDLHGKVNING